jgi:hypothetical protein
VGVLTFGDLLLVRADSSFCGSRTKLETVAMNERFAVRRQPRNGRHSTDLRGKSSIWQEKILQAERDQKADEARIDDAITKAESEIAALERRQLGPEELQRQLSLFATEPY